MFKTLDNGNEPTQERSVTHFIKQKDESALDPNDVVKETNSYIKSVVPSRDWNGEVGVGGRGPVTIAGAVGVRLPLELGLVKLKRQWHKLTSHTSCHRGLAAAGTGSSQVKKTMAQADQPHQLLYGSGCRWNWVQSS